MLHVDLHKYLARWMMVKKDLFSNLILNLWAITSITNKLSALGNS